MANIFKIKANDGHYLGYKRTTGELCLLSNDATPIIYNKIIALKSEAQPGFLFLFPLCHAHEKDALKLKQHPFQSPIYPLGYEKNTLTGHQALTECFHYHYLSFPPVHTLFHTELEKQEKRDSDHATFVSLERDSYDWESVTLEQDDTIHLEEYSWILEIFSAVERFFQPHITQHDIENLLKTSIEKEHKKYILNLFLPFLELESLKRFSQRLLESPLLFHSLKEIAENNFWLEEGLETLINWEQHQNRAQAKILLVGQEYDFLHKRFLDYDFSSIFEAFNAAARYSIKPKKKSCIILTVRNEGLYLLSWIAWHKQLGFEHIFIYSNNNDDGSDEILKHLAQAGIITWLKNDMGYDIRTQAKIYKHAFSVLPHVLDYEWALVCDADEYFSLNQDRFPQLDSFIHWIERYKTDAIGINWKYVASEDGLNHHTHHITERNFHYIAPEIIGQANNLIKSIVRPRKMLSYSTHHGIWSERFDVSYRLPQGYIHRYAHNSSGYQDDPMWADYNHHGIATIVHYHFKSSKEFLLKLYRGDALDPFAKKALSLSLIRDDWLETYNRQHQKFGDKIPENRRFNNERFKAYYQRLLELPQMKEALHNIHYITGERIKNIYQLMKEHEAELGEASHSFLENITPLF